MEENLCKKDFVSGQMVKWCPGCGDYAILNAVQNALPQLGKKKEDFAFISGIGCSSRFPYYMNTYGFHTIHGRAPAIATGVKVTNPNLDVWVISGDGDSLSIGGNHFIHTLRRNVGLKYIIFNNQIYGLTKGQYSPTSKQGLVSKSSPYGTIEHPFNPAALAIGAGCTFYARVADNLPQEMTQVILEAAKHPGTALIEVLQNCVIFNDKSHAQITARDTREDHQLKLVQGQPMIFGKNKDKGIMMDRGQLKVVTLDENNISKKDLLVHDATQANPSMAFLLSQMALPDFPVPMGILRQVVAETYEDSLWSQIHELQKNKKEFQEVLKGKDSWEVS